jgi:hypothetical protein
MTHLTTRPTIDRPPRSTLGMIRMITYTAFMTRVIAGCFGFLTLIQLGEFRPQTKRPPEGGLCNRILHLIRRDEAQVHSASDDTP